MCFCYDFKNSATHHFITCRLDNNRKKLSSRASPGSKIMANLTDSIPNGCSIQSIAHQSNLIVWLSLDKTVPKMGPIKSSFLFLSHTNQSHISRTYIEMSKFICLYQNRIFFLCLIEKKKKKIAPESNQTFEVWNKNVKKIVFCYCCCCCVWIRLLSQFAHFKCVLFTSFCQLECNQMTESHISLLFCVQNGDQLNTHVIGVIFG